MHTKLVLWLLLNIIKPVDLAAENFTECDALSHDTMMAMRRTETQKCRDEMENIGCITSNVNFFPTQLKNTCSLNDKKHYGEYVGCLQMQPDFAAIRGLFKSFDLDNSPERCVSYCYSVGYSYAGVKNGPECHCTNDDQYFKHGMLPKHKCIGPQPCPGNQSLACGGKHTALVFKTGLTKPQFENFSRFIEWSELLETVANSEEPPVRIVFLIHVSGRAIRQIRRTLNALYSPIHYYYIHVDSRNDFLYRELLPLENVAANIRLKRQRFATIWGGFGMFHMQLSAIRELFELFGDWKWDFVTNLSESDFPLLTIEEFAAFLSLHRDKNFMDMGAYFGANKHLRHSQVEAVHHECDGMVFRVGSRHTPKNMRLEGGQDYYTLGRAFAEHVTFSQDTDVLALKRYFNYSVIPLEHFFQTVLQNTQFCTQVASNALRFISFYAERGTSCHCSFDNIDMCACSPWIIQQQDFDRVKRELAEFNLYFLGRKFDPIINQGIIAVVELDIFKQYATRKELKRQYERYTSYALAERPTNHPVQDHRKREELPVFFSYWHNDYHWLDRYPETSPAKLALLRSLARLSIANLTSSAIGQFLCGAQVAQLRPFNAFCCAPEQRSVKVLELTFARHNDRRARVLVLYKVTCRSPYFPGGKSEIIVEVEFARLGRRKITQSFGQQPSRLVELELGTALDRNEVIFRNYAGAIGTTDRPSLKHEWKNGEEHPVQIRWIDPYGVIRGVSKTVMKSAGAAIITEYIGDEPASFTHPMAKKGHHLYPPGLWTVEVHSDKGLLGSLEFAVLPSELAPVKTEVPEKSDEKPDLYAQRTLWTRDGPLSVNESASGFGTGSESKTGSGTYSKLGHEVFVDSMTSLFYKHLNLCFVVDEGKNYELLKKSAHSSRLLSNRRFENCAGAKWSSRFPDPKSVFDPWQKLYIK